MKTHSEFLTTSGRGLDRNYPMLKMFQKAKKLGTWGPVSIDLTHDREHWQTFDTQQKDATLRLISLFQAGEESVTLDLLPLIQVVAGEGRAVGVLQEVFQAYEPEAPFGLDQDEFMNYAMSHFTRRENRLARACHLTMEQLFCETEEAEAEASELTRQIIGGHA